MYDKLVSYVQAGFDESLLKFIKGVFAAMLIAGADYSYKHLTGTGLSVLAVAGTFVLGQPALIAFWHWLKSTSADTVTYPDGSAVDGETVVA